MVSLQIETNAGLAAPLVEELTGIADFAARKEIPSDRRGGAEGCCRRHCQDTVGPIAPLGKAHLLSKPHAHPPKAPSPFRYFNSPPEVIRLVVMMYARFSLSLRNVKDLLFKRGIDICHETARHWWNRFAPLFAADIRRPRVSRMRGFRQ